jgi:dynein heavy chain
MNKLLIFVDDLNVPMKEQYGAQPPLEIMRQWSDMKGCYNKHNEWYSIQS